jgi:hypothetical protein
MQVEQLSTASGKRVDGPLLFTPQRFGDEMGFSFESWNQHRFDAAVGRPITFVQDNHSRSNQGVLRGLHYQLEAEPQGKLVRCSSGAIFKEIARSEQFSLPATRPGLLPWLANTDLPLKSKAERSYRDQQMRTSSLHGKREESEKRSK